MSRPSPPSFLRRVAVLALAAALVAGATRIDEPRTIHFRADDPLWVDADMVVDASKVAPQELSQSYDFLENTFALKGDRRDIRALNVNTLDEVPDSSWFTNRITQRPIDDLALAQGPNSFETLRADAWTIVAGKNTGLQPGFRATITGANDKQLYQIEFDPPGHPQLATGAEMIGTLLYHALGYHVVENYIVYVDPATITIAPDATYRDRDGRKQPFTRETLERLFWRAARSADGTYRALASRFAPGKPAGQFRYYGTRHDDPNDIYPHEHRRELRAARVFAAWVNHDDSRANNTLDMIEGDGDHAALRHYMFDFGSIMGSGTTGPDTARSGRTYLIDAPTAWRVLRTFGLWAPAWARRHIAPYHPSVGPYTADGFEPADWKAEYPNAAFLNMRPDDAFWGARRVAAFTDAQLRLLAEQGRYSDPAATAQVAQALIGRRDAIARQWLTGVTPLVSPVLVQGRLRFANAAVDAGVCAPPSRYVVQWEAFDNATGIHTPVDGPVSVDIPEAQLPAAIAQEAFVVARVHAVHPQFRHWSTPVAFYFRRQGDHWTPVGLYR
ncbi:hypothetical protein TBR22_A28910 [Luteitalea sp. TBR-22]|uniref:hypothetical protein n=1 Tax=Luteitalea sp. TBR-22 TaxID=2802971 RepID=UPI001AF42BD4|nr:hypothetical protein [Luteitalea sp. TBR-22]BCS33664.1 hypothetical protein TBR22_A28910 [Luteitalea sp. TBR-22]